MFVADYDPFSGVVDVDCALMLFTLLHCCPRIVDVALSAMLQSLVMFLYLDGLIECMRFPRLEHSLNHPLNIKSLVQDFSV